jgi:hypothetical protein
VLFFYLFPRDGISKVNFKGSRNVVGRCRRCMRVSWTCC